MAKKEDTSEITGKETFKDAIVALGVKLCEDLEQGRTRGDIPKTLDSIANLYNAIK